MFKRNWLKLILISAMAALPLIAAADETRYQYDENAPEGMFSLANFRASLRGLAQMDVVPLRPQAKRVVDGMEYTTNASAQAQYSGTGVTITAETSIKQEGSASLKAVIDGTADRSFARTLSINLAAFQYITTWSRSSATASAIQFYVSDGTNSSYWNITTDASASTWKQHTLTLASPDANSGSPASLAAVTSYGFRLLDASTTYYFDAVKAIVGMSVAVRGTNVGDYYRNVYLGISPVQVNAQAAPTLTAPTGNPRIDILTIDSAGALAWVTGTEASSPTVPWASMPTNKIPVALVYCKTTMTKVLDYEDKDTDANQGYIYADVRPFLNLGGGSFLKGADVASGSTITLGNDGNVFDITGVTQINTITARPAGTVVWLQFDGVVTVKNGTGNVNLNGDFVTAAGSVLGLFSEGSTWREISRQPTASTFLSLTDAPSSYSGQASKHVRVNSGATALEFVSPTFLMLSDTPSSYSGNAGKVPQVNAGETAMEFVSRVNIQLFTSSGSWVAPAGVTRVFVTALGGGGGGGGGGSVVNSHGGGGGGGGAILKRAYTVTPGSSYSVTVGAGGAAGLSGNGGAGGASGFDSLGISAPGGAGGTFAIPGVGGLGGCGTTNFTGTPPNGGTGLCAIPGGAGATAVSANPGGGGGTAFGAGGAASTAAGANSGGGGGGGVNNSSVPQPGGAGGSGLVILEW